MYSKIIVLPIMLLCIYHTKIDAFATIHSRSVTSSIVRHLPLRDPFWTTASSSLSTTTTKKRTQLYSSSPATTSTTTKRITEPQNQHQLSSLASSYVIRIQENEEEEKEKWTLVPLKTNEEGGGGGEGAIAVKALKSCTNNDNTSSMKIICSTTYHHHDSSSKKSASISITLQYDNKNKDEMDNSDLLSVLSRIMVQRSIQKISEKYKDDVIIQINFPDEIQKEEENILVINAISSQEEGKINQASILFSTFLPPSLSTTEWVEMVDASGMTTLGILPRILVHQFNLLHRGIGVVVMSSSKNDDSDKNDVYVHKRTDAKRIFPSLYDMFVGGVSLAFEDSKLTAAREVAEEIGLSRGLKQLLPEEKDDEGKIQILSNELFKCVICTSYNRCVVTVFTYSCFEEEKEHISWQEEEVAWGGFVPYDIVEQSARLSIDRLKEGGKWPGTGMEEDKEEEEITMEHKVVGEEEEMDATTNAEWKDWDYVPDGLLVWEAWLKWRKSLK